MSKRVELWLETDAGDVVDILSFRASFQLNSIPQASCVLAGGRRFTNGGLTPSASTELLGIREKTKVTVKGNFQDLDAIIKFFPDQRKLAPSGEVTLFEGYGTGLSYNRGPNEFGLELGMEHWLADMAFSSAITESSHAGNPANALESLRMVVGDANSLTGISLARKAIAPGSLADNIWAGGVKQWLQILTEVDNQLGVEDERSTVLLQSALGQATSATGGVQTGNAQAAAALARIKDDPGLQPSDKMATAFILGKILDLLVMSSMEAAASASLWDNLIQWVSAQLLFAVVPRVSDALVVPYLPSLRTPFETIRASEISPLSRTFLTPRQLRGVVMNIPLRGDPESGPVSPVGLYPYENPDAQGRGLLWYTEAPAWLTDLRTPDMVQTNQLLRPISTPGLGPPPTEEAAQCADAVKGFVPDFLRALYHQQVLQHRVMQVGGVLRYDICPGSTVKIECPAEKFVAKSTKTDTVFYGSVASVSHAVSSMPEQCSTTFGIAAARTEAENQDDAYTVAAHPLYRNVWTGAALL